MSEQVVTTPFDDERELYENYRESSHVPGSAVSFTELREFHRHHNPNDRYAGFYPLPKDSYLQSVPGSRSMDGVIGRVAEAQVISDIDPAGRPIHGGNFAFAELDAINGRYWRELHGKEPKEDLGQIMVFRYNPLPDSRHLELVHVASARNPLNELPVFLGTHERSNKPIIKYGVPEELIDQEIEVIVQEQLFLKGPSKLVWEEDASGRKIGLSPDSEFAEIDLDAIDVALATQQRKLAGDSSRTTREHDLLDLLPEYDHSSSFIRTMRQVINPLRDEMSGRERKRAGKNPIIQQIFFRSYATARAIDFIKSEQSTRWKHIGSLGVHDATDPYSRLDRSKLAKLEGKPQGETTRQGAENVDGMFYFVSPFGVSLRRYDRQPRQAQGNTFIRNHAPLVHDGGAETFTMKEVLKELQGGNLEGKAPFKLPGVLCDIALPLQNPTTSEMLLVVRVADSFGRFAKHIDNFIDPLDYAYRYRPQKYPEQFWASMPKILGGDYDVLLESKKRKHQQALGKYVVMVEREEADEFGEFGEVMVHDAIHTLESFTIFQSPPTAQHPSEFLWHKEKMPVNPVSLPPHERKRMLGKLFTRTVIEEDSHTNYLPVVPASPPASNSIVPHTENQSDDEKPEKIPAIAGFVSPDGRIFLRQHVQADKEGSNLPDPLITTSIPHSKE